MALRLQPLRKERHITQEGLATMTGIHRVTIARYESGAVVPTFENAEKIADALNVSIDDLRGDDHDKAADN